jgi:HEAT repeat protein
MGNHDELLGLVAETDEDRRWDALRAFVIREPSAARRLGEMGLSSNNPRAREVAADVLGSVASVDKPSAAAVADLLIACLAVEEVPTVLDAVITALGHAGDSRARVAVMKHGEHPDENVRFAVAWSLPSLGLDEDSLAALRRLSADPDEDVRDWATFGLAESEASDHATTEALAARTDDPHDDTRAEAILGLARRHHPRTRSLIERELARPVHGSLIERALDELEGVIPVPSGRILAEK